MPRTTPALATLLALIVTSAAIAGEPQFPLTKAAPHDAFLCAAGRHNPERDFHNAYWCEVKDALIASGVITDVLDLVGSLMDDDGRAEMDRLQGHFRSLINGIDWEEMFKGDIVFVERMPGPMMVRGRLVAMGPAHMLFLVDLEHGDAAQNYAGFVKLLDGFVTEVNRASGGSLVVDEFTEHGAEIASVNLLSWAPGAPQIYLSVARHGDVVALSFGRELLMDSLALLDDPASGKSLADDPRFVAAFEQLPPAEDGLIFFDMQNMLGAFETMWEAVSDELASPSAVYINFGKTGQTRSLNGSAMRAYHDGDYAKALSIVQGAYELEPDDSLILYNLACFNALLGNKEEALDWIEQAVEKGFFAPGKISTDSDLESLHGEPRFKAALKRAAENAMLYAADDVVVNSRNDSEAYKLSMRAWSAHNDGDDDRATKLIEQAFEIAPQDSRVLYYIGCFRALREQDDEAFAYLERAVKGGFYCPNHIRKDPDLDRLHDDPRYDALLTLARQRAAEEGGSGSKAEAWARVGQRLLDSVSILDYTAAVEYTEGHSMYSDTLAVLVPDAKRRPIYKVLCGKQSAGQFDRFLPRETESFSISGGVDLGELYTFIIDTVHMAGPAGDELLDHWAEVQEEIGFNIERDFIDWIGTDWISVTLADGSSISLVEVRDAKTAEQKVATGVKMLSEHLSDLAQEAPMLAMFAMQTSPSTRDDLPGFHRVQLMIAPTETYVWGVAEDHLIFASSEDAAALCLKTARGAHPTIRENERAMRELVLLDDPAVGVSLSDYRKMGDQIGEVLDVAGPMSSMMMMFVPDPDAQRAISRVAKIITKLGPVARKIDFYKSASSCTTFDGEQWHTLAVIHCVDPADRAPQAELVEKP